MEIVGNGFLARHLRPLADRHPGSLALAAGISTTAARAPEELARERRLVTETAARCGSDGLLLVFFSTASSAMYGGMGSPASEDTPAEPISPYGRHKLALERLVAESGTDFLVLRLSHLMGPDQPPHHLLPALLDQARRGEFRVHSGATRDILDVADAVAALDGLLLGAVRGQVVNVASGRQTPIEIVIDHIERRLGLQVRRSYVQVEPAQATAAEVSVERLRAVMPGLVARVSRPGYVEAVIDRCLAEGGAGESRPVPDSMHVRSGHQARALASVPTLPIRDQEQ
ncbi:MAG TPA: NAD-dependent epimerase/dehydratase family protein [Streptosporangiaceae bacterium]|nr:NAD-dependent epimerase/dehydratase family protein [Streptosporangiaceae bacterium]